jgi:signal transduction histidine kinase
VAVFLAVFTVRSLRTFEFHRQQRLVEAQQRVQQEIARQNEMRQEFLHRVVDAQEEERTRIARELHDQLGQMLTGLAIGLRGAQTSINDPPLLTTQLSQLEETATEALGDMRSLVNELRPALLDDMGLAAAMRHYVNKFSKLTGIQTNLEISPAKSRLSANLETILFRITQEALTNVARHARASQIWVKLCSQPTGITLEIKDGGIGFSPATAGNPKNHHGWGLVGIQERVSLVKGELQIESRPGAGTRVEVIVPLSKNRSEA